MVTVLFVDVTGSTPLGERLDPEAIRRIFSRYFGEVAAIVTRHGGTLEKFAGDALVAVFGHPVLHEDDALRAVRAAAEARAALAIVNDELVRDYGLGLNTRTGVNTGEVVTGDNATGSTIATGDMVNVAARLEARAQPGEIVIGAATYRLVRDAVTVEELEPLELKGKSQPVAAYRLVDLAPDAPGLARRLESPLVGRSLELAELLAAFEEAVQESSCRAVTLLGDAGSGKSRLAHELATVVGERAAVLEGRCVPYGEGITYFPLSIMLKPLAGIEDGDTRDAARDKLLALLPGVAEANLIVARLAGAIGLDDVLARPEEIAWAVRRLLESLARERPVLIFLDDLHWAELTFLRLIQHLVEFGGSAPILVVCSSRPDLTEMFPYLTTPPATRAIVLDSLPQTAAGGADLEPARRRRRAGDRRACRRGRRGQPALHRGDGADAPRRGADRVARHPLGAGRRPRAGRAAALDRGRARGAARPARPGELQVLQRASVIGRIFGWGAVRALTPEAERDTVAEALEGLLRKEVVFTDAQLLSGEDAYRFGHILVRDAAYRGLPKETRSGLHEQFASFLEESTGDRAAEYEEIIGYHLEQAFMFRTQLGPVTDEMAALEHRAARPAHVGGRARASPRRPAGGAEPLPAGGAPRGGQCRQGGDADARRPRARPARTACRGGRTAPAGAGARARRTSDELRAARAEIGTGVRPAADSSRRSAAARSSS